MKPPSFWAIKSLGNDSSQPKGEAVLLSYVWGKGSVTLAAPVFSHGVLGKAKAALTTNRGAAGRQRGNEGADNYCGGQTGSSVLSWGNPERVCMPSQGVHSLQWQDREYRAQAHTHLHTHTRLHTFLLASKNDSVSDGCIHSWTVQHKETGL